MNVNLIPGIERQEIHALHKYTDNLQKYLLSNAVDVRALRAGKKLSLFFDSLKLRGKFSYLKGFSEEIFNFLYYPFFVKKKIFFDKNSINHITSQEYAYLPALINISNLIITCFDLFPLSEKDIMPNYRMRIKLGITGLKKSKFIIVSSNSTRKELVKNGIVDKKIRVIPVGYDSKLYYPRSKDRLYYLYKKYNLKPTNKYILYVGSEIPRKNTSVLLETIAILLKKRKDISLIKIGKPQGEKYRNQFIDKINKLKINNFVKIIDFVPEKELPLFYNLADIFFCPSKAEGFGMPLLEAMASGLPAVVSNIPSFLEIIANSSLSNFITASFSSPKIFADKINYLFENNQVKYQIVTEFKKRADDFVWEKIVNKTKSLYEECLIREK